MNARSRFWIGLLVTPLLVGMIGIVLNPVLLHLGVFRPPFPIANLPWFNFSVIFSKWMLIGLGIVYCEIAIFGLPTALLLRWRGVTRWPIYAAAGAIVAVIAVLAISVFIVAADSGDFTFGNLLNIVALPIKNLRLLHELMVPAIVRGILAAMVFWLIARPDRAVVSR